MEPVCVTEKVCFASKQEALTTGLSIGKRKKDRGPIKAYSCKLCCYWHLSSGTTTKHKKFCSRIEEEARSKYRNNLKPYMFNGPYRGKKKKKR